MNLINRFGSSLRVTSLLISLFGTALPLQAQETYPIPNSNIVLTYSEIGDPAEAIKIIDCNSNATGALDIPSVIGQLSVTSIGFQAFRRCVSLTSVTIPDSITSIDDRAFFDCDNLERVTIGDGLTSLNEEIFGTCPKLYSVTFGDNPSVTSIEKDAFANCNSLKSIVIPDSVTSIEGNAFRYSGLERIEIPDSVTSIEVNAFFGCSSLTTIEVAPENSTYESNDGVLFSKDPLALVQYPYGKDDSSYQIPSGVTKIEANAFVNCTHLEGITIPASVTSIGSLAFYNCVGLQSALFEGDAPPLGFDPFLGAPEDFRVYYYDESASGFGISPWTEYDTRELTSEDEDDDGFPNTLELALGTDFLDTNDRLRMWFTSENGSTKLHYAPHSEEVSIVLESTTDLNDSDSWTEASSLTLSGDLTEQSGTINTDATHRYYRLKVE